MKRSLKTTESIWNWKAPPVDVQKVTSSRRHRALIQCIIMLLIASILVFFFDHHIIGMFVYTMATLILISGFFIPKLFNTIEFIGRIIAKGIGMGLTWSMLLPFFYCIFFPARLILKLRSKDPMKRIWDKEMDSYWIDRTESTDPNYYRRQY